jgi:hypothetical protein
MHFWNAKYADGFAVDTSVKDIWNFQQMNETKKLSTNEWNKYNYIYHQT